MSRQPSERAIVFLVGAVQFVNILDFMMVMPLGPDFAVALDIPVSQLGYVGGAYTLAASVTGLLGSFFLDRFDRRPAIAIAMLGLVLGTAAGGVAVGMGSLLASRLVAGAFGGPATSLAFAIVADMVPAERRGRAMGAVMGAFAVASVLGVPAGLELARLGGWRLPFFAVAALGLAIVAAVFVLLPPVRVHLEQRQAGAEPVGLRAMLARRTVQLSLLMTAVVMTAGFILIPNIAAFLQYNLSYPREKLGFLYLAGGAVSFVTVRRAGRLVDRYGSFRVGSAGVVALVAVVFSGFFTSPPLLPVLVMFMGFMFAMGLRNVAYNTLATKVPLPTERARFMSIQSSVQHLASAAGAFLSARMLDVSADGALVGMERIAAVTIALTLALPLLLRTVENRVRRAQVRPMPEQPQELQSGISAPGPGVQSR